MPTIMLERKNWSFHPHTKAGRESFQQEDRNEHERFMREQFGWLPLFAATELTCKVCGERMKGDAALGHLQTKSHLVKREELLQSISCIDPDFCDGCPNLMQEDNPWSEMTEQVCRLGYAYQVMDYEGTPSIIYEIDEDLTRPGSCIITVTCGD